MSVFTARKLKEARVAAHFSQEEVAKKLKISERKIRALEADQNPLSVDDLLDFAKLYKVDVRELILESHGRQQVHRADQGRKAVPVG